MGGGGGCRVGKESGAVVMGAAEAVGAVAIAVAAAAGEGVVSGDAAPPLLSTSDCRTGAGGLVESGEAVAACAVAACAGACAGGML